MGSDAMREVNRPREIPLEISGFEKPLFSLLDETAGLIRIRPTPCFKDKNRLFFRSNRQRNGSPPF